MKIKQRRHVPSTKQESYLDIKKKKRAHDVIIQEGISGEMERGMRDRAKTIEEYGRSSNLAFNNLKENLAQQNRSIFDRIRLRKEK